MDRMFKSKGDQAWRSITPHYESDLEMCTKLNHNLSDLHLENRVTQSTVKVESIAGKKADDKQAGNTNLDNLTSEPQNYGEKWSKNAKTAALSIETLPSVL